MRGTMTFDLPLSNCIISAEAELPAKIGPQPKNGNVSFGERSAAFTPPDRYRFSSSGLFPNLPAIYVEAAGMPHSARKLPFSKKRTACLFPFENLRCRTGWFLHTPDSP